MRRRDFALSMAAAGLLTATGCQDPLIPPTPTPTPSPTPSGPLWAFETKTAVEIHFVVPDTKALDLVKASGADGVRMDLIVADEFLTDGPTPPAYNWKQYGALIDALGERHLDLQLLCPYLPKTGTYSPDRYKALVQEGASLYPQIDWEGPNEFDGSLYVRTPQGTLDVGKATAFMYWLGELLRDVTDGLLTTSGLSTPRADWAKAFKDSGMFQYWNFFGVHPYGLSSIDQMLGAYQALKDNLPDGVGVATTEYSQADPVPSFVDWFIKFHRLVLGSPYACLYELKWTPLWDSPGVDRGILNADYSPKKCYTQFADSIAGKYLSQADYDPAWQKYYINAQ